MSLSEGHTPTKRNGEVRFLDRVQVFKHKRKVLVQRLSFYVFGVELVFLLLTLFAGWTVPLIAWIIWTLVGVFLLATDK